MPVYNGEKYITHAIESVLAQTYKNFEIIIVNDGSTDNSFEKIKPYLSPPNIRYFEQENKGVAAARNTGIKNSTGELIAFLDHDDLWLLHKLELQVDYMNNNPKVAFVHGRLLYIDENGKRQRTPDWNWITPAQGRCFRELFIRNRIGILTVLLRRECLDNVGLFDEDISKTEDYELWMRILRSYPIGYIDEPLACYRAHGLNATCDDVGMALAELDAVSAIVKKFPEINEELGSRVVNGRLFDLHFAIGNLNMRLLQNHKTAGKYFWAALKNRPFYPLFYIRLCTCVVWYSLTGSQRGTIKWYWHRLKSLATNL